MQSLPAAGGNLRTTPRLRLHSLHDLKAIAKELKKLKDLLKGGKAKGSDISEKLIQLGEHTVDAASMANRGFKGAIQTLGKSLTKLGKSIE